MPTPIRSSPLSGGIVLLALLAAGCVTPVSESDVESKLGLAAASFAGLGQRRVIPIYAETKLIATALLAEAKTQPESKMSLQVGRRLALAARRRFHVVIGGPYPKLSERIVLNAFALNREGGLRGLTVVFVSEETPSPALAQAAKLARARLYHRDFP
jgi:hypothetical protein